MADEIDNCERLVIFVTKYIFEEIIVLGCFLSFTSIQIIYNRDQGNWVVAPKVHVKPSYGKTGNVHFCSFLVIVPVPKEK